MSDGLRMEKIQSKSTKKYFCAFMWDHLNTSSIENRSIPFKARKLSFIWCYVAIIQFMHGRVPGDIRFFNSNVYFHFLLYTRSERH